jgi:hypothetical protein
MSDGLVADSGVLWVGTTAATAPTKANHATAMATISALWLNVGRLAKQGVGVTSDPQITELFSFGDADPTRTKKTREIKRFTAQLQAWNTAAFTLAFNGGTITVTTGVAEYVPVADTALTQHSLCWEFEDGADKYRFYCPLVEVRSGISMGFSDEDYTTLPLEVTILKPASGSAWYLYTNDADFTATP